VPVLIVLSTSFVAVPAFIRVEPAITSGPTLGTMQTSAQARTSSSGSVQQRKPTRAPRSFARRSAARTYGVVDDVAIPRTKSRGPTSRSSIASAPASVSSSEPSWLPTSAAYPPAITPWTSSGSVPKVGGHSAASSTPNRPLVPAPT
jgi:hypothetical protein